MKDFFLARSYYIFATAFVVLLLGFMSIYKLPVQLLPDISRSEIQVTNRWPQASPEEVEREITEPMEALFSKIGGVIQLKSDISLGYSITALKFASGTDMGQAYMDVIDRVNQFPDLPKTALEPVIKNLSINNRAPVAVLLLSSKSKEIPQTRDVFTNAYEKYIKNSILAIQGVKELLVSLNPVEKRIDVIFEPERLAMLKLTIDDVRRVINNSLNTSSGQVDQGARRFTVRFKGRYEVKDLNKIVVAQRNKRSIRLEEIASVSVSYVADSNNVFWNGKQAFYITVYPTSDANTLALIDDINQRLEKLNKSSLGSLDMLLENSRDDSISINSAMAMVKDNLFLGILLSSFVLFAFIRSKTMVLLVLVSLPISIFTSFLVLSLLDRSLNIISLAGIALSAGMILDAAIVVVDSITRRRQAGMATMTAVQKGTSSVVGAIVTSVVSSVIIFLPILTMGSAEGQLFHDLAITISSALVSSLVVSVVLIPVILKHVLDKIQLKSDKGRVIDGIANRIMMFLSSGKRRIAVLVALCIFPTLSLYFVIPHAEVLPKVNGSLTWGYLNYKQSLNYDAAREEVFLPLIEKIENHIASGETPVIDNYLLYSDSNLNANLLVNAPDGQDADQLKVWIKSSLSGDGSLYDMYSGIASILRTSLSDNREVSIDISGNDYAHLREVGKIVKNKVSDVFPDIRLRTNIPLDLENPNIQFTPINAHLFNVGENQRGLADKLSAMNYGSYVAEYFDGNKTLPLFIKARDWESIDKLLDTPFYYPDKGTIPLRSLVDFQISVGADELFRLNGHRTLSIKAAVPEGVALQEFIKELDVKVGDEIAALMNENEFYDYRGSASRLQELLSEMKSQFAFALLLLFLLLCSLFQSIKYGLMCLMSLPIAIFGGAVSLQVVNLFTFQPMDIITMLGFIILIGLVTNNAILLVECYKDTMKASNNNFESIISAVRFRARAILMSSLTSIFGMLPLAIIPGAGVEVYRGLAVVIVGGMCFSLLFSVPVMSVLLSLDSIARKGELPEQFEIIGDIENAEDNSRQLAAGSLISKFKNEELET